MPLSENKKKGNKKWDDNNITWVSFAIKNELYEEMMRYVIFSGKSKSKYIIDSIICQIEKDKEKYD